MRSKLRGWAALEGLLMATACFVMACGSSSSAGGTDGAGAGGGSDADTAGMNGGGSGGGNTDGMNDRADDAADAATVALDPRFAAFCAGARNVLVERLSRCEGWAPPVAQARVNRDPCKWWGAAIAGRRMIFDGQHADECLAQMRTLACSADAAPGVCDRALWGVLKPGEACSMAAQQILTECEADSICILGKDFCQGQCRHRSKLGEPCVDGLCVVGTTCDLTTRTCGLKARQGEPCGERAPIDCEEGLFCPLLIDSGEPCSPRMPEGARSCVIDIQCVSGTLCDLTDLSNRACRKPKQVGDPCTSGNYGCSFGGLTCGSDMKCRVGPALGEPCNDGGVCLTGACDTLMPSVCKLARDESPCRSPSECGADRLCEPTGTYKTCSALCTPR